MKLTILKTFTRSEARIAMALLEMLIDALIELHTEMCRSYNIRPDDLDDLPF